MPRTIRLRTAGVAFLVLLASGLNLSYAQQAAGEDEESAPPEIRVEHPECTYFGPMRDRFKSADRKTGELSVITEKFIYMRAASSGPVQHDVIPGGTRTNVTQRDQSKNLIDQYLFAAMQEAGVAPADRGNDFEFIRRVTLDLTGRIPAAERLLSFAGDGATDKRARLVDELLAKPEWVDKWTMYFGDLFLNTTRNTATGVPRYAEGRDAFYQWIRNAVLENRPYNRVAAAIISAKGDNSYDAAEGQINWLVNGRVPNGPIQDTYDQMAANVAETFLGMGHVNCILCHNGRGHLDSLSLWGRTAARTEAWGLAAFFVRTVLSRTPVTAGRPQPYYWSVGDPARPVEYQLNTTTGNRPARCANGLPATVENGVSRCSATGSWTPEYPFSGRKPAPGEDYRTVAAEEVTKDFQFARAAVNYIWKEFFGRGIVEPANQFDPARLDPDNAPPEPWTLQPSNARLLNALAQEFINSGYDLKWLMRLIATSEAYQLSAEYNGNWNPANEKLFARKLVRRLWAEEIHDAIVQASAVKPNYNLGALGRTPWAMQFPEPRGFPGGAVSRFLDAFLRGNRDDEDRRGDGSLSQALSLMNDNFVVSRAKATGSGATASLLRRSLEQPDDQLVQTLFLTVLSRYPTDLEKATALAGLRSGNRTQKAENLLWSLYNKVDFIFNY
ncbi:MAG: DUF1553 domain-containing protein [Acidobacteria bacterium]|nr:DUF1553 domain-containing protein [Acidobacteriota bacterium]